jgi:hypothetical protein
MAFGDFTVTRASTKLRIGSNGLYGSVANNVPAFEFNTDGSYRGLLVEPGATNLALNSRNLTTASWTATNVTTAQTATGADGGANSATTLTASAGNGTVLQAITSASASRVFSAVVRRRTGTGVVEITQDNGSTWTAITLTSSFQRFATPNQTLTNPTVGFRIVTSGDAIDVDFTQAETGSVATSPIVTTAGTASRVADVVSLTGASSLIGQMQGTMFAEFAYRGAPVIRSGPLYLRQALSRGLSINYATSGEGIVVISRNDSGTSLTGIVSGALQIGTIYKIAVVYNAGATASGGTQVGGITCYVNGVSVATGDFRVPDVAGLNEVRLYGANSGTDGEAFNGNLRSVALFPTALTSPQAVSLTTV